MEDQTIGAAESDELTPQEQRLIDCAEKGERWLPERIGDQEPDMDPAHAKNWDASRNIRAGVIRCLATGAVWPGADEPWQIDHKGIMVDGARVTGELDLEGAILDRTLLLQKCIFDALVNLHYAETRIVSFDGS